MMQEIPHVSLSIAHSVVPAGRLLHRPKLPQAKGIKYQGPHAPFYIVGLQLLVRKQHRVFYWIIR